MVLPEKASLHNHRYSVETHDCSCRVLSRITTTELRLPVVLAEHRTDDPYHHDHQDRSDNADADTL